MSANYFLDKYKSNSNQDDKKGNLSNLDKKEPKKFVFKKLEEVVDNEKAGDKFLSKKRLAALLIILSDSDRSTKIISAFSEEELIKISSEILSDNNITREELAQVEKNFGRLGIADISQYTGGKEFLRNLLQNSFGISKGSELFLKVIEKNDEKSLSFLETLSLENITDLLRDESELIIAYVLSSIDSKLASKILPMFPKPKMLAIIKKMSDKIEINSEALEIIIRKLREKSKSYIEESDTIKISGKNKLIEILKHSNPENSEELINEIESTNPDLAHEIKENIFTFSDIPIIKKTDFEYALKGYPDNEISFILKGASDEMKIIFFTCMTKRRRDLIKEEMKYLGEVKKSDVEQKRKEFIIYLRNLEQNGKISLQRDNDIYVS